MAAGDDLANAASVSLREAQQAVSEATAEGFSMAGEAVEQARDAAENAQEAAQRAADAATPAAPPAAPQSDEPPSWFKSFGDSVTQRMDALQSEIRSRAPADDSSDDGIESVEEIADQRAPVAEATESTEETIAEANPVREHGLFRKWFGGGGE